MDSSRQNPADRPATLHSGLRWGVVLGLLALVAVTTVVGVRDSRDSLPEVPTPCMDGTQTCEEWQVEEGFQPEYADWGAALAIGAITGLLVALATLAIRTWITTTSRRTPTQDTRTTD